MAELATLLTPRLEQRIAAMLERQQQEHRWHGALPVLLLERCWLHLEVVPVARLAQALPPDSSADAPELVRFRQLRGSGLPDQAAQEQCWEEFGRQACSEALRRYWQAQDEGNHGWTLARYLTVLALYRRQLEMAGPVPLPMLVLARGGSGEAPRLEWCCPAEPTMRHTCP